jgi:hypothetical protein
VTTKKLKNGAIVLKERGRFVLCKTDSFQPYVTWEINKDGATFTGHYFETREDAEDDFRTRIGRDE